MVFKGRAPDLRYVEEAARVIGEIAIGRTIVVEKSTVPVKAAESISNILASGNRSDVSFQVCSSPNSFVKQLSFSELSHLPNDHDIAVSQADHGSSSNYFSKN